MAARNDHGHSGVGSARTFEVGVIGCGNIALNVHLPTLMNLPEVRIGWVADINERAGTQAAELCGTRFVDVRQGYSGLPPADVVLVSVPWGARKAAYAHLASVLPRPCLFVEKPVSRSREEHAAIFSGYEEWEVGVGFFYRSLGVVNFVRSLLRNQVFGPLRAIRVEFGGLGRILTRGGYSANFDQAGGGVLMEMGVHYIDSVWFCTGADNLQLQTAKMRKSGPFDLHTEGCFTLAGGIANGIPFELCVTTLKQVESGIEMTFDNATLRFNPRAGCGEIFFAKRGSSEYWPIGVPADFGPTEIFATMAAHWRLFLAAISQRRPTAASITGAPFTAKALELLYAELGPI
jgi:predicted dehydrogenase